jgi:hypothetical protein
MTASKTFSQASENNKNPILQIIRRVFIRSETVWEIGSGTGQHACFFASQLPHLFWQPTDRTENLPGINLWLTEAKLDNIKPPLALDVNDPVWPCANIEAIFTANTLHIMSAAEMEILFQKLAIYLAANATMCIYGPFNYGGQFTSDSNARFDNWLKQQNPLSGIRDFEQVCDLASAIGLTLIDDHETPANNRLLIFQRRQGEFNRN